MMEDEDAAELVADRDDLVAFLERMAGSFKNHPNDWENSSIDALLSAWSAWLGDMDGFFENRGESVPTAPSWRLIAQMLLAARIYE